MTGVIVLNKPQEFTSFDAVAVMRGIFREKKIGHSGTLDPMATGVLPILIGKATKASDLLPENDKTYIAKFKLGIKTSTGDIWGEVKENKDFKLSISDILEALPNFRGDIKQIPPMYSAVSVGGTRLYKLARQGIEVEREAKNIYIKKLELLNFDGENGELEIECSKGTYIRTLIEDIAESLGTVATMTALERTKACGFTIENALTIKQLQELKDNNELEKIILPVENLFSVYKKIDVTQAQATRFLNGGELSISRLKISNHILVENEIVRLYFEEFLGLGKVSGENLKFLKHFKE